MNSPLRVVLWVCLVATIFPIAHAQETSVSVAAVYQLALENSPALHAQAKRIEALQAGRAQANNLSAGPLTLEGSYRSDRNFDNQGLRETELGISAPIWLWNERSKTQQYWQAELQAGEHRFAEFKLKLAGQVRQIYWNALAAQQDVLIAQARLSGASELMKDVQRRVDAGDLARADLLQATALHAQAKAEYSRALSGLAAVGAEFIEVTGLPVGVLGTNTSNSTQPISHEPLPSAASRGIESQGIENHPTFLALQSEAALQSCRASLLAVQTRENPEVGLAIVNDRAGFAVPNEKSLVVSTRIPLGASAQQQSLALQARADETEAQARVGRITTTLKAQANAAQASMEWFEQLQANAQQQAALAQEVYALHQQSFSLGETDLPTLLRLEQQAFEAERMAKKSSIEYASKVSALRQALGLLPEQAP
jgi:outer membrane protein, heavy metal efflux system